jgi:ABC-type molybdate transport system permease subunit
MESTAPAYSERLTAPAAYWAVTAGVGVMVGLVFLRVSLPAALIGLVAGAALCGALVVAYGQVGVSVQDGHLEAGTARLPLAALGTVTVLDAEAARRLRTTEADVRAFMLLRSYVPTAVRVDVADPEDPTPYLYLSTRRPEKLAKALSGR